MQGNKCANVVSPPTAHVNIMNTTPPRHTQSRADGHAAGKAARLIVLLQLIEDGTLDALNKTKSAKLLGVSRWTLDRDIATIVVAREMAVEMLAKLK